MKETEYKFLINQLPKQVFKSKNQVYMEQYYFNKNDVKEFFYLFNLSNSQQNSIDTFRLRIEKNNNQNRYIINSKALGLKSRDEFEVEVSEEIANKILSFKPISKLEKIRYEVECNGYEFQFDKYLNKNNGLLTCEVEVNDRNDNYIEITKILEQVFKVKYKDVTEEAKYKNINLGKEKNMKTTNNLNEWLYSNLDLIEECRENNLKPVVLIGGASSSGKSFTSKMLKNFLIEHGYNPVVISTDNYNKGIAENIFDIVNEKYYNNTLQNKQHIVNNIRSIIIDSDFGRKFDDNNLQLIKKSCQSLLNTNIDEFLSQLRYEFENINFDKKSIYDLNEVSHDLQSLIENKQIKEKSYSKVISERVDNKNIIDGKNIDVVIVEGIYALTDDITKNLSQKNLIKNFVDCNNKNLFLRRIIRDSQTTNCSKSFILKNYLQFVVPEYLNTVLPTKDNADLVLNNNMTFEELRQGKVEVQQKYELNQKQFKTILAHAKLVKKTVQTDTFFGNSDDDYIVRLREEKENDSTKMTSLIYKGKPKLRKDQSLIRPTLTLLDKNELSVFKNKEELIESFANAGIKVSKTITKNRLLLSYKDVLIKIDLMGDKIIMELDKKEYKAKTLVQNQEKQNDLSL